MKRIWRILFLSICVIFLFTVNVCAEEILGPDDVDAASFAGWTVANDDWRDWSATTFWSADKSPFDDSDGDDDVYDFYPCAGSQTNNNGTISKEIVIPSGTYTLNASAYVYRYSLDCTASMEIQLYDGSAWTADGTYVCSDSDTAGSWKSVEINNIVVPSNISTVKIILSATVADATTGYSVDFDGIQLLLTEASGLTISVGDATADEDAGIMDFTITLSEEQTDDVTVEYATENNTATTADSDYTNTSGTATISAGDTTTTVSVPINDDTYYEANENFYLNLSNENSGTITNSQATGTITDNDSPPTVTLSIENSPLAENGGAATITATLSKRSYQNITVYFNYTGTATGEDIDYRASATSIIIPAESFDGEVTITGKDDSTIDPGETVIIGVESVQRDIGVGYVEIGTGNENTVTAIITDDDAPDISIDNVTNNEGNAGTSTYTFTVSLSTPAGPGGVTFDIATEDNTASVGTDYEEKSLTSQNISQDSSTYTFDVTVNGDTTYEENDTYYVNITNVTGANVTDGQGAGTITNDDTVPSVALSIANSPLEESVAGVATVTATLSNPSYLPVTVNLSYTGTATGGGTDYAASGTSITIHAGATTGTVTITGVSDTIDEDNETVIVDIDSVDNGMDSGNTVTAIITDNYIPSISINDVTQNEGDAGTTTYTFTVSLSIPAGAGGVSFDIATANNTASSGTDYVANSLTGYTIPQGSSNYNFDVTVNGDTTYEPNETFYVNVTNVTGASVTDGQGLGTITNDDPAPASVVSVGVPADDTYITGEALNLTVNFSENVTVNTAGGIPTIPVTLNTGGVVNASYVSGSGTSALVFSYIVVAGNEDTNGIVVGAEITANGATIKNGIGVDAILTLNSIGSTASVLVDAVAPTVSSVSVPANATYVVGQDLTFTVNFSENVTVNTGGGTPTIQVTLNTGAVNADYVSGSGTSALVFSYTVVAGNEDTDGIEVGAAIALNGGTIKDAAGNNIDLTLNSIGSTALVKVDGIIPTVLSVNVPANDTYVAGEALNFTVNYSEAVAVTGTPRIPVTLNTGGTVNASYESGTGTSAIVFRYTVVAGNQDTNGIEVGAAIALNGGTLKDATGNDAILTLNGVGATTAVLVDAADPTVVSVGVPANGTYVAGQNLDFTVNFSENVTVNTGGGTPTIQVTLNTGAVNATYESGSGTSALVFRYTVVAGNEDTNGITVGVMSLNEGTIKDGVANNAVLTLNSIGSTASVLVDAVSPTVSSVSVPANATYVVGQDLTFTVNFSENVTVNTGGGTPTIQVTLNTGAVNATYESGSGTSALVFRYTVVAGNEDTDGIEVGAEITLNGGTIKDAAGNNIDLTLNSIGSTALVKVDGIIPTVVSVAVPANDTYVAGEVLNFTVNYSKAVAVNTTGGTPYIPVTLNTGGTVNASYESGTGTSAIVFSYTVVAGNQDTNGIEVGAAITLNGGTLKDAAGNNAGLTLNSVGTTAAVKVDTTVPTISAATLAGSNAYVDITFTEGIFGAADGTTALTAGKLAVTFTQNGGAATNAVISSVKKNDSAVEGTATALAGGETTVRVFLTITGTPAGGETIEITPTNGTSIYDKAGNAMAAAQTTGIKTLRDATAPAAGTNGTITAGVATTSTIDLSWTAGTDNVTIPANLQYEVVRSNSNNIDNLVNAVLNGTIVQNWANITSKQVTGLTAGTTYYFNVIIKDEAGNMTVYTAVSKATNSNHSGGNSDNEGSAPTPTPTTTTTTPSPAIVIVNGQAQNAGTVQTTTVDNQTVTTVTVDDKKIEEKLATEGTGTTVIIPVNNNSDVVVGQLNGQTVKNMETKEAVLEIKTENVTYTLPASEINIDDVSSQIGESVALKDIKISVRIAEPPADTAKIVQDTANKNNYQVVVKPVNFEITCTNGNKTVYVSKFNGYVERMVAIPEGIDPSKITTGIILNKDGTFSHVPTSIVVIGGKPYAKINSLTNSTYSVIWSPKIFKDVENHWAKEAINDMGSRLVVNGIDEENFAPDREITRGEFAAIVVKGLGLMRIGTGKDVYRDVKKTDWYYDAVYLANEYGLINGTGSSKFEPNRKITREEAMIIIARAMSIAKMNTQISETETEKLLKGYKDSSKINSWAKDSAAACIKNGIVAGSGESIKAEVNITRAEVAAIVRRLLQKAKLI